MEQTQFWLPQGTLVGGRYTLDTVLGKGGYGITYRGMDTRLQQQVAIKEYYPVFWCSRFADKGKKVNVHQGMESQYCKGLDRFLDEARTLAQLAGITGVVRVTDFFEENGTAYLVMEFLDGKNLKQMLDGFGGRIPPKVLLPVLSPALFALRKVHEKGLIHRDLSPDNIMMLEDGSVRVIDFGNARDTTDNKSMTLAMKEGFAAPEQYRSKGQGPYTDVYGMCATIYYCLTGKLPPQAMERLMGAPLLKPSELGVAIPPWQEEAIVAGLELYVQKRIQSMEELWERLYNPPVCVDPIWEEPVFETDAEPVIAPVEEPEVIPVQEEPVVIPAPEPEEAEPVPESTQVQQQPPVFIPEFPEPVNPEPSNPMEGMTVPLVREEAERLIPPEPEEYRQPEQPVYHQPERYFVPPKPVNVVPPQYPAEPEHRESLVERMQNVCARIFRKRKDW